MKDARKLRQERIENEYKMFKKIYAPCKWLKIQVIKGTNNYVEEFDVYLALTTIIGIDRNDRPINRKGCTVNIKFPNIYPGQRIVIIMKDQQPFHPNWWKNGLFCYKVGEQKANDTLAAIFNRLLKSIVFDDGNTMSAANLEAAVWWNRMINKERLLKCDFTELPNPYQKKSRIKRVIY